MSNYILDTYAGNSITTVAVKAKEISIQKETNVQFDFNGVTCIVSKDTDVDLLVRDYLNSHLMEWKEVGPNCLTEYSPSTQAEFEKRTKDREARRAIEEAAYRAKEIKERNAFNKKVKGIDIELKDAELWKTGKENNQDSYGACIYEYAEGWAKLMQYEMKKFNDSNLNNFAERTSHELGFLGITGFMYGAAVSVLSQCWKHGEALRKWHNKEYNHEGEGVVNPAILTMQAAS